MKKIFLSGFFAAALLTISMTSNASENGKVLLRCAGEIANSGLGYEYWNNGTYVDPSELVISEGRSPMVHVRIGSASATGDSKVETEVAVTFQKIPAGSKMRIFFSMPVPGRKPSEKFSVGIYKSESGRYWNGGMSVGVDAYANLRNCSGAWIDSLPPM